MKPLKKLERFLDEPGLLEMRRLDPNVLRLVIEGAAPLQSCKELRLVRVRPAGSAKPLVLGHRPPRRLTARFTGGGALATPSSGSGGYAGFHSLCEWLRGCFGALNEPINRNTERNVWVEHLSTLLDKQCRGHGSGLRSFLE